MCAPCSIALVLCEAQMGDVPIGTEITFEIKTNKDSVALQRAGLITIPECQKL